MGFTHYFEQKRDFSEPEWAKISSDISTILSAIQNKYEIQLADSVGAKGTAPTFTTNWIAFNGLDAKSYETFKIRRVRAPPTQFDPTPGSDCCKTARYPYDLAVIACLAYLSGTTKAYAITSDGHGDHWTAGVEVARLALPEKADSIDIPLGVLQDDRWIAPWIRTITSSFKIRFCVDGHGYVLNQKTGESYCFESHYALAKWLNSTKAPADKAKPRKLAWGTTPSQESNIWNATGAFDQQRHAWIAKLQERACEPLFPAPPECAQLPPHLARPGQFPIPASITHNFDDLIDAIKSS